MYEKLRNCSLFRNVEREKLEKLFEETVFRVTTYSAGDLIASSGDSVEKLRIVIEGSVRGEMTDFSGKTVKIEDVECPRPLAPAFMFGDNNRYPVDIVANEKVRILSMHREEFVKMMSTNRTILDNYLNMISNRAQFLSGRLKFLSFQTIKGKLAHYFLSLMKDKEGKKLQLNKTQQQLAELFGVTRPSLSRAIREMDSDGLIKSRGKTIEIINHAGLSALLK